MGRYVYEPADGHGLPHDPMNAIVGPRPIGWIGTRSAAGVNNLAPYSFFNLFNYRPPIIGFASVGQKDSVRNVRETGEFVWNLATRALGEQMNQTSIDVGPEVDELALVGLTPAAPRIVSVPLVAESPVCLECRVTQIVPLTDVAGGATPATLILGEVVAVHIDEALLVDGIYDTAAARPILRGGGPADYFEITPDANFKMRRPSIASS
jgi:flavin reductase (DIM6/NTAB) family NADH-FMN oxidoreductase RutF